MGPGQFPPPQKRKSPVKGILLGLVALVGLGLVGLVLLSLLNPGTTTTNGDPSFPPDNYQAPPPDLNPEPIPVPDTYGEATDWMKNNKVYQQSITVPSRCDMKEIDATTASAAELTTHLNELTACLMRVWDRPLQAAGFTLPRPPVTVYTQPITTACGPLKTVNAVYCGNDQRIYYAKPLPTIFPSELRNTRLMIETILAHEFGHTVQARTGIIAASSAWQQKVSDKEAKVYSRRTETQADCLAGMWVAAVRPNYKLTEADMDKLLQIVNALGDDELSGDPNIEGDHGHGKSRMAWFRKGLATTQIGTCNTYIAPESEVR